MCKSIPIRRKSVLASIALNIKVAALYRKHGYWQAALSYQNGAVRYAKVLLNNKE